MARWALSAPIAHELNNPGGAAQATLRNSTMPWLAGGHDTALGALLYLGRVWTLHEITLLRRFSVSTADPQRARCVDRRIGTSRTPGAFHSLVTFGWEVGH
jgi:hypothetical protein